MGLFGGVFKKLVKPVLIAAAVAAVVATGGTAIPLLIAGESLVAAVGAVSLSSVIAAAAVAGLTTAAGILLGPKQKAVGFAATAAVRQAAFNLPIVYGRTRVGGGMILYQQGYNHEDDLIVAIAIACHKIKSVKKIYAGDTLLFDSDAGGAQFDSEKLSINIELGDDVQGVPSIIANELKNGPSAWKLNGVAYYVVRLKDYADHWSAGVGGFWAEVEGCADIFNPLTGNQIYTDNWALCVGDYLTRARGGGKLKYGVDVDTTSLKRAAAICNDSVIEDGGTQKRYTLNGVIDTGTAPINVVKEIKAYGVGDILQVGAKYHIIAGAPIASSGTLTLDDLASPLMIDSAVNVEDYPDGARGVYTRADGRYQTDSYPSVILSDAPAQPQMLNVDLPMSTEPERAQRLASAVVRHGRRVRSVTTALFSEYLTAIAGVVYDLSMADFGLEGPYRIESSSINITASGAQIDVMMVEYSATLFDVGDVTQPPVFTDSSLPSPLLVAPPTSVVAVAETVILGDGTTRADIRVTWVPVNSLYDIHYEVRWRPAGGTYQSSQTDATLYIIQGEARGVALTVEVRAVNIYGGKSAWIDAGTATPSDDITPPPAPTATLTPVAGGFVIDIGSGYVYPADFSHFKLYEGADGAAFGATTNILTAGGRQSQFRRDGLSPDVRKSYYVTAVDQTGNESGPSARKDGKTPTLLTQAEIDAAIAAAEQKADDAQAAVDQVQVDADQAIADALANAQDIQQLETELDTRYRLGAGVNALKNTAFTLGPTTQPDYWYSPEEGAEYTLGLVPSGSTFAGVSSEMRPLRLARVAGAVDQSATIVYRSERQSGGAETFGIPVQDGEYVQISADVGVFNCEALLRIYFRDAAGSIISTASSARSTGFVSGHPEKAARLWANAEVPAGTDRATFAMLMLDSINASSAAYAFLYRPMMTQGAAGATQPAPYVPGTGADAADARAYFKQTRTVLENDGMALAQDLTQVMAQADTNESNITAEVSNRQTAISNEQQARALAITQTESALKNDLRGSTEVSQLSLADIEGMLKSSVLIRSVAGKYQARIGVLAGSNGTSTILLDARDVIVPGTITAQSGILANASIVRANIKNLAVGNLQLAGEAVTWQKLGEESVSKPYNASRGSGGVLFNVHLERAGYISARVYAAVDIPPGGNIKLRLNIDGVTRRTVGAGSVAGSGTPIMLIASVAVAMGPGYHTVAGQFSNPQPNPVQLYGDAMGIYA